MIDECREPLFRVDLAAIAANTRRLSARTTAGVMAVVKADGFGHGTVQIARTALDHGAAQLGVTTVTEALELRRAALSAPILSWLNAPDTDFAPAIAAGVDLAVPGVEHLRAVEAGSLAARRRARIHLHADTGMARDGAAAGTWPELCRLAARLESVNIVDVVGVMGHLSCADNPTDVHNGAGREAFDRAVRTAHLAGLRPRRRHLAATAALLGDPRTHHDLVRVGAGLYGIDPTGRAGLRYAAKLTAPVATVREVPAGTPVGYGHTWTTNRRTRLALIPLGYADGLPRAASGLAQVQLRGRRCPLVGVFSMDQIVVDVGEEGVAPGEVATLFGPGDEGEPTVEEWARWAGTLPHELLTSVGSARRITRRHLPAPATTPTSAGTRTASTLETFI
ncbi:alanine racemase [Streptomyces sp. NPDC051546]|uniref:alanine racemase n=1 Tax=Streptomyces sp. NPDC051546 TaxID=3365655 RepID=UPI0037AA13F6